MRAIKNVTSSWNWPNLSASNCCTCPPTRPTSISSNACGNSSRRIVCTRPITTTLRSSNRPSHPVSLKLKPHTGPPSTPCFPTASRPLKNQKLCQCRVYIHEPQALCDATQFRRRERRLVQRQGEDAGAHGHCEPVRRELANDAFKAPGGGRARRCRSDGNGHGKRSDGLSAALGPKSRSRVAR